MIDISTIFPKLLYKGSSEFSKDIRIIKSGYTTKLLVNGLTQSLDRRSGNQPGQIWNEVAQVVYKNAPLAKKFLLLGMGTGTILHILQELYKNQRLEFTSVEIDQILVELSKKYFESELVENNRILVEDAEKVISNPQKFGLQNEFDVIIIDTYIGDVYSENVDSTDFLDTLCDLAKKDTLILFNRAIKKTDLTTLNNFLNTLSMKLNGLQVKKVPCPILWDNFLLYGVKKKV